MTADDCSRYYQLMASDRGRYNEYQVRVALLLFAFCIIVVVVVVMNVATGRAASLEFQRANAQRDSQWYRIIICDPNVILIIRVFR